MDKKNISFWLVGMLLAFAGAIFIYKMQMANLEVKPFQESELESKAEAKSELMPEISLTDLSGDNTVILPRGDGIEIVNIFASWCPMCMEELPLIKEISEQWNVPVSGIAIRDTGNSVRKKLNNKINPFNIVLLDPDGSASYSWGVKGLPETIILVDGKIVFRHRGVLNKRILEDMIGPIVLQSANR